jgi:hypothetical protein
MPAYWLKPSERAVVTDPRRLLDWGATALELRMLRAADADAPDLKARMAAVMTLGLGRGALRQWWTASCSGRSDEYDRSTPLPSARSPLAGRGTS